MISLHNERLYLLGLEPTVFRGRIASPMRLEWNPPCLLFLLQSFDFIDIRPCVQPANNWMPPDAMHQIGSGKPTSFVNGTTQGNLRGFLDRPGALTSGPRAGPVLLTGPIPIESAWVFSRILSIRITSSH